MKNYLFKGFVLAVLMLLPFSKALAIEYSDLNSSHWAYEQIMHLTDEGVLVGYPDGSFHPDENVTRAEFATMVIKAVSQQNAEIKETINFEDITPDFWAWDMIQRAVTFDIVKKSKDNRFYPQDSVTRGHAIEFVINSLSTDDITEKQAREALKKYTDYKNVEEWIRIKAGKAEVLNIVVKVPGKENVIETQRPATRAELAVFLVKLEEQVKINANKKLKEAMKPKTSEGIVINEATVEDNIATIPAGTVIPVVMCDSLSSQKSKLGSVFVSKAPKNFVTKEKYLLIVENSPIYGQVLDVKIGRYFVKNGILVLETKSIKMSEQQVAKFSALAKTDLVVKGFWQKLFRAIFKGAKINIEKGQVVDIQLLQPVKINLINGLIVQ